MNLQAVVHGCVYVLESQHLCVAHTFAWPRIDVKDELSNDVFADAASDRYQAWVSRKRTLDGLAVVLAEPPKPFNSWLGVDCRQLPLHPQRLLDYYSEGQWKHAYTDDVDSMFMCDGEAPLLDTFGHCALPCGAKPHNVCPKLYETSLEKWTVITKGLSGLVDTMKPSEAKLGEAMFMFSAVFPGEPPLAERLQILFAQLVVPVYSPKVQIYVLGDLATEGGDLIEPPSEVPECPFYVLLRSRGCKVAPKFTVLDMASSDELALRLLGARKVEVHRLEYTLDANLMVSRTCTSSLVGVLWQTGLRTPYRPPAGPSSCLDASSLRTSDPFAKAQPGRVSGARGGRRGGRGRGRGAGRNALPQDGDGPVVRALADAAPDVAPMPDFDLEGALGELLAEYEVANASDAEEPPPFDEDAIDIGEELEHAWANAGAGDWPCEDPDPTAEQALLASVGPEDEHADADLSASSSSAGGGGTTSEASPAVPSHGSSSSSSSSHLVALPAAGSASGPEAAVVATSPMDGVQWKPPADGGYVLKHGCVIGRLTSWGKNLSIKCNMHGCSIAVSNKVSCEAAVAWLVAVPPLPTNVTYGELAVQKARLKNLHMVVTPRPRV
jgi:hypothetical protein